MALFYYLFQQVMFFTACILVSYCVTVAAYRLYLHPLKDYPGPLLAKVTDAYTGFHALMMHLHLTTWEDHEKYGRVVRHGPNKLVFNSAEALRDIYLNERLSKSRVYLTTLQASTSENVWSAIDKKTHRRRRKMITSVLSDRSLRQLEPVVVQEIDIFLGLLVLSCQGPSPRPVNMTELFRHLTLDIVGHLAFGHPPQTQTRLKARFLVKGLQVCNFHNNVLMAFPSLAHPWLVYLMHRLTARHQQRNLDSMRRVIKTRTSQGIDAKNDLYHAVMKQVEAGDLRDLELTELWSEAAFFYIAGGDTSATLLSALFFYLSRDEECYRKLASEIRSAFPTGANIRSGPQFSGCQYLRACIDETLRISPPAPGTLWRELPRDDTEKNGPLIIDGHVISPGVQVGVCTYAIHHNEEFFPEPFAFRPERWVGHSESTKARQAFAGFSLGSRACAGKGLAYLDIGLTAAKTLWYFDFERAPGALGDIGGGKSGRRGGRGRADEFQLYDIFTATHSGPLLTFRPRGDLWKEI